jgi:phosphoserine phosphatase
LNSFTDAAVNTLTIFPLLSLQFRIFTAITRALVILVVDFDGTYLKNDFFAEQFYKKLIENPSYLLYHGVINGNLVKLKHRLLRNVNPTYAAEQLVQPTVAEFLRNRKAQYNSIVLVTASPEDFVKRILHNDTTFDEIHGTKDVNLKGNNKLQFIRDKFGEEFHYIGDSSADTPIFQAARKAFRVKNGSIHEL